jgi:hypothetical protein
MDRPPARLCVIVAAVAMSGCGVKLAGKTPTGEAGAGGNPISTGEGGGGGGGGTGGKAPPPVIVGPDGGASEAGVSDGPIGTSTPDANCGAKSKSATKLPPDVLIVLDRSNSMNNDVNDKMCTPDGGIGVGGAGTAGCGKTSKWAAVVPALTQVIADTENDVNWGLKFFPTANNECVVGPTVAVGIAPKNAAAIAAGIAGATNTSGSAMGFNGTPTSSAIMGATEYMQTLTDMNPKFILLATDGAPTCGTAGADSAAGAITAVQQAATASYKTFVVGIATKGGDADGTLSGMANAGGLPRAGTPSYYPVANTADLASAIRTLIGVAATCTFKVGPTPTEDGTTDLRRINVFGDSEEIPRDETHTDGYDYTDATMQSVQVYGPRCDKIMKGTIRDVTVTFRCLVT